MRLWLAGSVLQDCLPSSDPASLFTKETIMGKDSGIQWTHHTFNPWRGCTKVSEGCAHCYAEAGSKRNPAVLGIWGPTGRRVVATDSMWQEPRKWDRAAARAGERHRVFCASLADIFEAWDGPVHDHHGRPLYVTPDGGWLFHPAGAGYVAAPPIGAAPEGWRPLTLTEVRGRLWRLIDECRNLDWLILTKRPEHFTDMLPWGLRPGQRRVAWSHVWLGVSVENQARANERIPRLLQAPAAVRFLSCEPLLGPVDLERCYSHSDEAFFSAFQGKYCGLDGWGDLHWVIVGGESGHEARAFDLAWARSIVEQCKAAGVACFVKQMGARPEEPDSEQRLGPSTRRMLILADAKGGTMEEWPEDLRVREFPARRA